MIHYEEFFATNSCVFGVILNNNFILHEGPFGTVLKKIFKGDK
jgi:hypothetical protein